jgi:Glycine rich protein
MRNHLSKRTAVAVAALAAAAVGTAGFTATAASASADQTVKFGYTGQATTWTVPAGVTSIHLEAAGGTGGNFGANLGTGGYGADITGTLAVTPGETLVLGVGGSGSTNKSDGGWGYDGMTGGPSNTAKESDRSGGSGGGATFVGVQDGSTVTPLVIAAGGGGIAGGSGDPLNVGAGGSAGCAAIQNNFEKAGQYKCLTPTLAGMNGGDGTLGPLGGKGGKAGGGATGAGERGGGASELGGNGGSGGGGLKGGAAGTGAKGVSAGGGGGAGTSWYDTTAITSASVNTTLANVDTSGTLTEAGIIITYPAS